MNGPRMNITEAIAFAGLQDFLNRVSPFLATKVEDRGWWLTWKFEEYEGKPTGIRFRVDNSDTQWKFEVDGAAVFALAKMVTRAILFVPVSKDEELKLKLEILKIPKPDSGGRIEHDFDVWVGRREDKIWIAIIKEGMPNIRFETDNPKDEL